MAAGPYVPYEYWPEPTREAVAAALHAKGEAAAERIREQVRTAKCTCARPGQRAEDGRCSRCWGRVA